MITAKATFKINPEGIERVQKASEEALSAVGEGLLTELALAQVVPFDTGHLQNASTFVDSSRINEGRIALVSSTPYARRLYFHPEYNFRKDKNVNAGGRWFDVFLPGHLLGDVPGRLMGFHIGRVLKGG